MLLDPLGFSGTHPRRFIMFSQNGGDDVCAREGGKHIQICASPFIKEFCMARHRFVFESRPSFFLKGSRPSPLPPIPFFKSPPPPPNTPVDRNAQAGGGPEPSR